MQRVENIFIQQLLECGVLFNYQQESTANGDIYCNEIFTGVGQTCFTTLPCIRFHIADTLHILRNGFAIDSSGTIHLKK